MVKGLVNDKIIPKEKIINAQNSLVKEVDLSYGEKSQEKIETPIDNRELADVIYIFCDKKEIGIKLVDLTPDGLFQLIGGYPIGEIIVNPTTFEAVKWNDEINFPNQVAKQQYRSLSGVKTQRVTTIMVSEQKMVEILQKIDKGIDLPQLKIEIGKNKNYNNQETKIDSQDDNYFLGSYDDGANFSK